MKPSVISKRITRRAYADRMAEREFVRSVLSRRITPEIEALSLASAQRSHRARNAAFLDRFRPAATAAA
ncbi:MAG: hypothetical protein KBG00_10625 [Rhodoferax sp.]|jgi:hypothetical protein|uniref:hypothetical protein n=1 Tax=Rhodoferax sp. TaxID=50421 RepID=UPI001B70F329|nr:hypothetical protein [Rhodoferax sp.]MBP9149223.1 hypothetical protein [Rhodoferax sp.]MBP9736174.1 hypothetical protein [Rhodoferax sp.]